MEGEIIVTVQPTGIALDKKWRFGVSLDDSIKIFKSRGALVIFDLDGVITEAKAACGPPLNKGFDFNGKIINDWIIGNGFHIYKKGFPTKLLFKYMEVKGGKRLTFLKKLP